MNVKKEKNVLEIEKISKTKQKKIGNCIFVSHLIISTSPEIYNCRFLFKLEEEKNIFFGKYFMFFSRCTQFLRTFKFISTQYHQTHQQNKKQSWFGILFHKYYFSVHLGGLLLTEEATGVATRDHYQGCQSM